ncbi:MAG: DNA gyrase subunit A [Dehalococcoidia bacterium]|nr:DNA gyrase subunit A [Dehalococcoidia bacterium]
MVTNIGNIRDARIEEELRSSYLDYAMSVIVARALPDVRDGLKPVQRRILYAMDELGMRPNTAHKKSARLVGEVLGKYHPHGDTAVYDAMVRMAQDFSLRYPLVDGQGNFGSIDDDPPAAMRYTEARLTRIATEMLVDIDRDTVDFVPNFDASLNEPSVLPARLPNLLVNGSSGIAVGMATSIPPHNLREVGAAVVHLIDNPNATTAELLQHVLGPDFPTGGIILAGPGRSALYEAYEKGQGRVVVRARIEEQEVKRSGRSQLVITEVPYQVNKATLVEKIAALVREKRIEGVGDVRDESDRQGMRVVVELRGGVDPNIVLNNLYKHTACQTSFTVNVLALVDGQPTVLGLRETVQHYVDFRRQVVTRRAQFDLRKAQDRAHILVGLRIALENLDEVIRVIRSAPDVDTARQSLIARFQLTVVQAQAILDMQLRRLTALDRQRLEEEFRELMARIAELEALLADPAKVLATVREETEELVKTYGDNRRTELSEEAPGDIVVDPGQFIQSAPTVVTLTLGGYIKRLPLATYRRQLRGGKGVVGMATREDDVVQHLVVCDTKDTLYLFTDRGRVYSRPCYAIREAPRQSRGVLVSNLLGLEGERVTSVIPTSDLTRAPSILLATKRGEIKRMPAASLSAIRASGIRAMDLEDGDEMVTARLAAETDYVVVVTRQGKGTRFQVSELTLRSRQAGGVRAMRLQSGDEVIAMDVAGNDDKLFTMSTNGYGKVTGMAAFSAHHRGAGGVIAHRITDKTGPLAWAGVVKNTEEDIVMVSANGNVQRTTLKDVSAKGRAAMGVHIMALDAEDRVAAVAIMSEVTDVEPSTQPSSNGASANGVHAAELADESADENEAADDAETGEDEEKEES